MRTSPRRTARRWLALGVSAVAACSGPSPRPYAECVKAAEGAAPREAMALYDEAIAQDPVRYEARAGRAALRLRLELHAGAVEDADAALERRPFEASMHRVRGLALLHLERFDEAVVSLVRACERAPDSAEGWGELALAALRARQFDRALSAADKAIEIDPETAYYADLRREIEAARK